MQSRVIIRRERPHALAVAIAYMITALAFYLLTLVLVDGENTETPAYADAPRVTSECVFEGGSRYFVYMGRQTDAQSARIEAARHMNRGAAGYLYVFNGYYYALGNAYLTRELAEAAASRIRESGIECAVIDVFAPSITVKLTAAEAQTQAVKRGYDALLAAESALENIAERLDAGALTSPGARSFAAIAAYELNAAAEALCAATPDDSDALCLSLRELVTGARDDLRALTYKQGEDAYYPARVKHARIKLILARSELLRSAAGG